MRQDGDAYSFVFYFIYVSVCVFFPVCDLLTGGVIGWQESTCVPVFIYILFIYLFCCLFSCCVMEGTVEIMHGPAPVVTRLVALLTREAKTGYESGSE